MSGENRTELKMTLKERLEKSIVDSVKIEQALRCINPNTFQPVIHYDVSLDFFAEVVMDSCVLMTELEMYTLIGKTIFEKAKEVKFGLMMDVNRQQVTGDL